MKGSQTDDGDGNVMRKIADRNKKREIDCSNVLYSRDPTDLPPLNDLPLCLPPRLEVVKSTLAS